MTPRRRNEIIDTVFADITAEGEFFLGFEYDAMKQIGRCNCVNTGFARIPKFTVVHKTTYTIIHFRTHHGDTEKVRVEVPAPNPELQDIQFKTDVYNKVKNQLQQYAGDWN